ncbi:unnamed protein product [Cylindrotheca closterium]|uniref:Uncharacterized protein n=1 Tax=Cylindrotheca closterium TaxID=2856 RepID=A0AAD2CUP3_9STRA|nr:unnamed protein product [Cylindrotheca closterium]
MATKAARFQKNNSTAGSSDKERAPAGSAAHEPDIAAGQLRIRKCMSLPYEQEYKSILKCKTVDESLHSVARSEPADIGRSDKGITFGNIGVREYSRTLGDNPSCSSGPPVSISWDYKPLREMSVEAYEESRPSRRSQMEMVLPRKLRSEMLKKDWAISQRQIAEAVRRNVKIKNQRRTTVNNLGKASSFEVTFEKLTRKIKRTLMFQKSVSKQCKELEMKHNEAQRLRKQQMLEAQMADEYETEARSVVSKEAKDSVVEEKSGVSVDSPMQEPEEESATEDI